MGWNGMGWDGMGWDGMGWDGMGWDGMGWDGKPAQTEIRCDEIREVDARTDEKNGYAVIRICHINNSMIILLRTPVQQ